MMEREGADMSTTMNVHPEGDVHEWKMEVREIGKGFGPVLGISLGSTSITAFFDDLTIDEIDELLESMRDATVDIRLWNDGRAAEEVTA